MKKRRLWVSVVFALAFLGVAALMRAGHYRQVEDAIYRFLVVPMSPALTVAAKAVSWLCNPTTVMSICVALLLLPPTRTLVGLPVTLSAGLSALLNSLLKELFARERPDILRLVHETSYSFPSGHSMTSAAVFTALFFTVLYHVKGKRLTVLLCGLCILMPLLIGVSRVYLGVHHAFDVLGGWLLGYCVGAVFTILWESLVLNKRTSGISK